MILESIAAWNTVFTVLSIAITVGNSFTIFIFTRKQFQKKLSHYLPINLAVTDLVVGAIALPLYISLLNFPGLVLRRFYHTFDIIAGVTSVSSIALISLERLYAIGWPLKHRLLKRNHYVIGIALTWLYAIAFMVLLRFVSTSSGMIVIGFHVLIWGMGLPLMITLVACVLICVLKKRSERNSRRRHDPQQDNKLAQTLLTVTAVFWLTWLPYTIFSIVITYSCLSGRCYDVRLLSMVLKVLHYSNSFANLIIYALRLQAFRSLLREICCNRRRNAEVGIPLSATVQTVERIELQELRIENTIISKTTCV